MRKIKHIRYWLAIRFPFLRSRILNAEENERLLMAEFRSNMALFGYGLGEYSDDDIKNALIGLGEIIRQSHITAEELKERLEKTFKILSVTKW